MSLLKKVSLWYLPRKDPITVSNGFDLTNKETALYNVSSASFRFNTHNNINQPYNNSNRHKGAGGSL